MAIRTSRRAVSRTRLRRVARELLDASTLCSIATVGPRGTAYANTAYFAWADDLSLVWMSDPASTHSRNIEARSSVAIAVCDSRQTWGRPDRGIQLFGTARQVAAAAAHEAEATYARRFPDYSAAEFGAYRFYRFRPRRVKLFDERALGSGTFVTSRVGAGGRLEWQGTEVYA